MKDLARVLALLMVSVASCFVIAQTAPQSTDLASLERVLESTYHLHGLHVPMMRFVSGFAHTVTKGGVSGMRVVTYENLPRGLDHQALGDLARAHLGSDWSLMVRDSTQKQEEDDLVFVQPAGKRVRMLVFNLEASELNIVQMELSPDQLKKWESEHGG